MLMARRFHSTGNRPSFKEQSDMPTKKEDALKLRVLHMQIAAGAAEFERGDFVEVDAQDLEAYLDRLTTTADSP
jgi:hypothetical protein